MWLIRILYATRIALVACPVCPLVLRAVFLSSTCRSRIYPARWAKQVSNSFFDNKKFDYHLHPLMALQSMLLIDGLALMTFDELFSDKPTRVWACPWDSPSGAAAEPLLAQRYPQGGVLAALPDELPLAVHPHNKVPDGCKGTWTNRAASLPRKG